MSLTPGVVLERTAAAAGATYLRRIASTATCVCVDRHGRSLQSHELRAALGYAAGNVLLVYWISDAMCVAMLPFLEPAFAETAQRVCFLFDDTFWGHVCERFHARLGGRFAVLGRRGASSRLSQLRSLIQQGGSYALAVDGGGPYGVVGSGLASLATTLDAAIVPVAVRSGAAVRVSARSRVRLPLPGSRLVAAIGRPITVRRETARSRAVEDVRAGLNEMCAVARAALARRPAAPSREARMADGVR